MRLVRVSVILVLSAAMLATASGCATVVSAASERVAEDLRQAVLDHDDPETVEAGAPAWLLMTDAMAAGAPGNPRLQQQAAMLYAAYANGFVTDDEARARRLSTRAREYGRRGLCARRHAACGLLERPFAEFESALDAFTTRDIDALYAAAVGELSYIQAHASDWEAIADLPRAESLLKLVIELDEHHDDGAPYAYLGVLNSLRPPALGGDPELGRAYFERSIELSGGRNLMAKVLYAEHYARLSFDRGLHDSLLNAVLEADVHESGFTLGNVIAQRRAVELLADAPEYFFDE